MLINVSLYRFTLQNTTYGGFCAPINSQVVVSAADINTILGVSNNYRSRVALGQELKGNPGQQPSATNMRQLVP